MDSNLTQISEVTDTMVEKNASDMDDSSEAEEENHKTQEQLNEEMMKAVKDNDFEGVQEAIKDGADVQHEEDKWNALLWAACNGNENIVRLLIKH